jgi:hypothetical protein
MKNVNGFTNVIMIAAVILSLSACATNPDRLGSTYVSAMEYTGFTCQQLYNAEARNERDAANLYNSMKSKSRTNATAGVVGALLFWPALIFMKGRDPGSDARLSELKGRRSAIAGAMRSNGC